MKIFPALVKVRFTHGRFWMPTLWLPVFLLWPFLVLGLALVFLGGFVLTAVLEARSLPQFFRSFGQLCLILCELHGTEVDVRGPRSQVLVTIH